MNLSGMNILALFRRERTAPVARERRTLRGIAKPSA